MNANPRTTSHKRPVLFAAAIAAAAMILPLLMLIERYGAIGADGLGNVWVAAGAYLGCVILSLILLIFGGIRGERPRWLVPIAIVLWALPALVTML